MPLPSNTRRFLNIEALEVQRSRAGRIKPGNDVPAFRGQPKNILIVAMATQISDDNLRRFFCLVAAAFCDFLKRCQVLKISSVFARLACRYFSIPL